MNVRGVQTFRVISSSSAGYRLRKSFPTSWTPCSSTSFTAATAAVAAPRTNSLHTSAVSTTSAGSSSSPSTQPHIPPQQEQSQQPNKNAIPFNNNNNNNNKKEKEKEKRKVKVTYYDFFPETLPRGAPPSGPFHIPSRDLRKEYLKLQQLFHPDANVASSSPSSSSPSSPSSSYHDQSALLNRAYSTLVDPFKRAEYILSEIVGDGNNSIINTSSSRPGPDRTTISAKLEDNDEDILSESVTISDPELLFEVLSVLEEIEDLGMSSEQLKKLKMDYERRINEEQGLLGALIESANWHSAKECLVRLRYWRRVKGAIERREEGAIGDEVRREDH